MKFKPARQLSIDIVGSADVWQRLLAGIEIDPVTGCWNWTRCCDKHGYGKISVCGNIQRTHRVAYTLFNGDIESRMVIDHLCTNRACCNPDHLEKVTVGENLRRRMYGN